jgi:hypothetical protein
MSSPVNVLQARFSARPPLHRRTARPEFDKAVGKIYLWEFFSFARGFHVELADLFFVIFAISV